MPEETIRRRYHAGIRNFFQLYRSLADTWRLYDNSDTVVYQLIASGRGNADEQIYNTELWETLARAYRL